MRTFAASAAVAWATLIAAQSAPPNTMPPQQPIAAQPQAQQNVFRQWRWLVFVCAGFYVAGSWRSIISKAKRRKYDATLALKYTDMFFKDFEEERIMATRVLINFYEGKTTNWEDVEDRAKIDPILDIFDDIGFLLQGEQISDWVVYQYFSYWIHLYYQAAQGYVEQRRREDNTMWEHVPDLYQDMMKIQQHKEGRPWQKVTWNHGELVRALKDEIDDPGDEERTPKLGDAQRPVSDATQN